MPTENSLLPSGSAKISVPEGLEALIFYTPYTEQFPAKVEFQFAEGATSIVGNGQSGNALATIFEIVEGGEGFLVLCFQNRYIEIKAFRFPTLEEAQEHARMMVRSIDIDSENMVQPLSAEITGKEYSLNTKEGLQEAMVMLDKELDANAARQGLFYFGGCWHPASS
jgi:hypothetical protein